MAVRRLEDASAFLDAGASVLLADEARHNLILGIAGTLARNPRAYREHHFWIVEDLDGTFGAALQTPPFNLLVARPEREDALPALVESLAAAEIELPGVTGAVPEVDEFASAWEARAGRRRRLRMRQRIYRLERLRPLRRNVPGRARPAAESDRALLVSWVRMFTDEAFGEQSIRSAEEVVDARLRERGAFVLWEDGEPVSLAGWGGETPHGVRVGPVYTPPEHRGRGYGSAVTAAVTAERLAAGRRFCFLYTDVANPTSNRIYTRLGYEPVCESVDYAFEPAGPKRPA
jgi:uncharacterized protein